MADIFIVTAPLTEETRGLVNKSFLSKMKKECLFVNVSRGGIVNNKDLPCSIRDEVIAGDILDVFEEELISFDSPLWNFNRWMLSPHNSFDGEGNMGRLERLVMKNIKNEVYGNEKD